MDRSSFLNRESGWIAIAVPLQAGCVIALALCVRECLAFWNRQLCVVARFLPIFARREIALVF
jgi:hypothetical protein